MWGFLVIAPHVRRPQRHERHPAKVNQRRHDLARFPERKEGAPGKRVGEDDANPAVEVETKGGELRTVSSLLQMARSARNMNEAPVHGVAVGQALRI
jgi:hypothetical protein